MEPAHPRGRSKGKHVTSSGTEPLRAVIVGGGLISDTHARALQHVDGAVLTAFVGGERSRSRAAQFGVPHYSELEAAVRHSRPDVAIICTPPGTHSLFGATAARLGLHVLVEKPIDLSLTSARALQQACAQAGTTLGVVSQRRFDRGFAELAELAGGGGLGRLTLGSAAMKCWRDDDYYRGGGFHDRGRAEVDPASRGGALVNQGIHTVDMLCAIMGNAHRVSALARPVAHQIGVEDVALALVEFDGGAVGTIEATTAFFSAIAGPTVANTVERLEISGTSGSAILSGGQLVHCSVATGDGPSPGVQPSSTNALPLEPFRLLHQDFVDAVRTGRPPAVTGMDGIRALELVSAIYESEALGAPVDLEPSNV
jgi:UDP-N-acetyl-2-amino-2-deoxyglucuronate dehydrogenase